QEGARVMVTDILGGEAERVAADIRNAGGEASAATIDVTSEPQWKALIAKTLQTYGRVDILVNNAGISGSSVGDPDGIEGWNKIIAVNQTSVFLGTKLAAEEMAKSGGGTIVNISSIMGFVGAATRIKAHCRGREGAEVGQPVEPPIAVDETGELRHAAIGVIKEPAQVMAKRRGGCSRMERPVAMVRGVVGLQRESRRDVVLEGDVPYFQFGVNDVQHVIADHIGVHV